MSVVQKRDGSWLLILHSSSDNSIHLIDFSNNSITALTLPILSPEETIMLKDFEAIGILVFYQQGRTSIIMLDFNTNASYIIETSMRSKIPNVVENLNVKDLLRPAPAEITYLSQDGVAQANVLSARFLQTNNGSIAASIISNLPEALISNMGNVEVLSYMRDSSDEGNYENFNKNLKNVSIYLTKSSQLATVIPSKDGRNNGYLELFNPVQKVLWRIVLPLAAPRIAKTNPATGHQNMQVDRMTAYLLELPNGDLLTMDNSGVARIWQVDAGELIKAVNAWKKLVGNIDQRILSVIYDDPEGDITEYTPNDMINSINGIFGSGSGPGNGDGESGQDGNGNDEGVGGGDGDPMNSKGRQQTFVDVEKLELVKLHKLAMQKRLEQINMTQGDFESYRSYKANVQREIRELHVILESIEAKEKERIWLKNQSSGDVDDTKLIEGLTGDINIYKRRGENDPESGFYQARPKKIYFVFDLSASMYRFNSHDRRLDRSMEVALMIMESFKSFEHKFQYQIFGHSGDSPNVEFVKEGKYPRTEKETFKVLNRMHTHSQFCLSGDNTLGAVLHAIKDITKEAADDYFVVVLSDANIQQYKINPEDIAK
ncbi:10507_t:CDS:10, partial [Cetraspora pellucida]